MTIICPKPSITSDQLNFPVDATTYNIACIMLVSKLIYNRSILIFYIAELIIEVSLPFLLPEINSEYGRDSWLEYTMLPQLVPPW